MNKLAINIIRFHKKQQLIRRNARQQGAHMTRPIQFQSWRVDDNQSRARFCYSFDQ